MKTGRLIKTSDDDFCKMVNVPDEVFAYFENYQKNMNGINLLFISVRLLPQRE